MFLRNSHRNLDGQCNGRVTLLAGSRTGPNMPSESKVELIVNEHPRLVSSFKSVRDSDTITAK